MVEKEINLTYETMFELLRREKTRQELQPFEKTFYKDFITYMGEKKQILQEKKSSLDFNSDEVTKLSIQIDNINKIMKELYERREKKITAMTIESNRTGAQINTSSMLPEEARLYDELLSTMAKFKKGVLLSLLNLKMPLIEQEKAEAKVENADSKELKEGEKKSNKDDDRDKLVRFISPIPKFVGEELESYGPFEEEEIATLPGNIAAVLIKKSKAEMIDEEN